MEQNPLADRTIKLETGNRKTNFRPLTIGLAILLALFLIRLALPTPPERVRPSEASARELADFIGSTSSAQLKKTGASSENSAQAELGKLLFHDNDFLPYLPGRSGRNESCAGCHAEGGPSTTFLKSDRQAPDLTRAAFYTHFSYGGRASSIESFIASHIESRNELGSSRVRVARMMFSQYKNAYEAAFGKLPQIEAVTLPEDGTPSLDLREFPVAVSSFILETLTDRSQLESLLAQAQSEHLAPAVIVSRTVFLPRLPDSAATEEFYKLPAESQEKINVVFGNVVQSLAAYILSRSLPDTPYDRFAGKIAAGTSLEDALSPEFGTEELAGLKLFHGPAGCARCHNGPGFTDNKFHNIGLPEAHFLDAGHATGLALNDEKEDCVLSAALPPSPFPTAPVCPTEEQKAQLMINAVGSFRTAALRGFSSTRLLTHNGQIASLDDMLTFYSRLDDQPAIGKRSGLLVPLHLTKEERAALTAFLSSLGNQMTLGLQTTR